jgi:hypothetical protein
MKGAWSCFPVKLRAYCCHAHCGSVHHDVMILHPSMAARLLLLPAVITC